MVKVKCSVPNCNFVMEDSSEALVIAILTNHGLAHQNIPALSKHQSSPAAQNSSDHEWTSVYFVPYVIASLAGQRCLAQQHVPTSQEPLD